MAESPDSPYPRQGRASGVILQLVRQPGAGERRKFGDCEGEPDKISVENKAEVEPGIRARIKENCERLIRKVYEVDPLIREPRTPIA